MVNEKNFPKYSQSNEVNCGPPSMDIFSFIPEPVWIHIFSFVLLLDKKSFGICRVVCKKFRMLISSLWIQNIPLSDLETYLKTLPNLCVSITSLKLNNNQENEFCISESFKTIFSNLSSLHVHKTITDEELKHIPTSLTELNVSNAIKLSNKGFKHFPQGLRKIDFSGGLFAPGIITDEGIKNLPSSLQELNLALCPKITNEGLKNLPSNLQKLDLSSSILQNTNVSDEGLLNLPKSLRDLTLSRLLITDKGLSYLREENFPHLRYLNLTGCYLIKGDTLPLLHKHLCVTFNYQKMTPLIASVYLNNLGSAKQLLAEGVNINQTNLCGKSAFHFACEKGKISLLEFLIERGANVTQADDSGKIGLQFACEAKNLQSLEFLLEYYFQNIEKFGILHLRLVEDHFQHYSTQVQEILLKFGIKKDTIISN